MAFAKPPARKCSNCVHIDRETYRAVRINVCYLISKKDGKPIAIAVTGSTPACQYWREDQKKIGEGRMR